jgi:primosomal protein N' (replication factor Y) (superfamily II helicase)
MNKELCYVDVILPLAVPNLYTYSVPETMRDQVSPGQRIVVQFGKKKLYTGLAYKIHSNKPELYKAKEIESILDAAPIVNQKQFELWKWLSDYYMCTLGEVMNAALPSGLKLSSETKLILNHGIAVNIPALSDDEYLLYEALQKNGVITLTESEQIVQKKSAQVVIKSLLEKEILVLQETLKEKFKPKEEEFIRLSKETDNELSLKKVFGELEKKAFKQLEVLMEYVRMSGRYSPDKKEVKKSDLLKQTNASGIVLHELERKNIFTVYKKETGRLVSKERSADSKTLSQEQEAALNRIRQEWTEKRIVLFQGVTSSGKTEVYVRLIEDTLKEGKQVLYLLPEIALTTQVVMRIKKYFGDALGVYHSKFNENERVEVWNEINKFTHSSLPLSEKGGSARPTPSTQESKEARFNVILGARSALFLPFSDLGLVIVDEEHDSSYKQFDPAPRYHARDTAIVLATMHNAKVLLGSATPSLESFYNAQIKKFGFSELTKRFGGVQMPEIIVADIKDATKRKKMKSHFSPLLLEAMEEVLKSKEQIILFQNRRGFAPYLECKTCGWIPVCKNCDVSLVYHKSGSQLRCHYCGYMTAIPSSCSACGSTDMKMKNFGTEKIEEELHLFFPEARIARMDYDSTRLRFAHERLINDFEARTVDILVGTQMVTKGLDFENVSLVGILSADQMMNFPDFRSHEKSFQMLTQVSGRAGRNSKRGKVILQTYSPSHPLIHDVINNDFKKMYEEEIIHRENFHYPPFYRLIELTVIDKDIDTVNGSAMELVERLKKILEKRVLGPEFPIIPRIKNHYHKKIIIKIGKDESAHKIKKIIRGMLDELQSHPAYKYLKVQINVDPA